MKATILITVLVLLCNIAIAQQSEDYTRIDKIALAIPGTQTYASADIATYINGHFSTDEDKVRAIFIWIATNIKYDVAAKGSAIISTETPLPDDIKVKSVLRNRKGICDHYSLLFADLCHKVGIKAYVVGGYDRKGDAIAHAWNVVMIKNKWQLVDATWGAGATNDNHFIAQLNDEYFLTNPKKFIDDHMPFDYLWQLLPYPLTCGDFTSGNTSPATPTSFFAFADSIREWEQLSGIEQYEAEERRLSRNRPDAYVPKERLKWIRDYIRIQKQNEQVELQNSLVDIYNDVVHDLNTCIETLNEFAEYRSNNFRPTKPDIEIQRMLDTADARLKAAKSKAKTISGKNDETDKMVHSLGKPFSKMTNDLREHQAFLTKYLSKNKQDRKAMFH